MMHSGTHFAKKGRRTLRPPKQTLRMVWKKHTAGLLLRKHLEPSLGLVVVALLQDSDRSLVNIPAIHLEVVTGGLEGAALLHFGAIFAQPKEYLGPRVHHHHTCGIELRPV